MASERINLFQNRIYLCVLLIFDWFRVQMKEFSPSLILRRRLCNEMNHKSNMNWKHPATYHGLTRTNHSLHLVTLMLSRSCNRLTTIRTIMKLLTNHCYRVSVYKSSYLSLYKYHNTMNYKLMWLSNGLIKPYFKPLSSPSHQFVSTGDHWSDEWKFLIRVPKKYWEPSAQAMTHPNQPARPLIYLFFCKTIMIVHNTHNDNSLFPMT